jgi:hypothetical protein
MSKRDELIVKYKEQLAKAGVKVNDELLKKVTIGCGPSIYNKDASTVACSQEAELATVKNNYLIKKLGLSDGPKLDTAIKGVCEKIGSSVKNKYRAVFYYMLCVEFGKESVYNK